MAMSLVHMMPESAEIYGMWAKKEGIERPFPLPYVCYFLGYFLILCIDRVAARAYHIRHSHEQQAESAVELSIHPNLEDSIKKTSRINSQDNEGESQPDQVRTESEQHEKGSEKA